ncbi:MAG: peptide-methionine (S)-S-oxide reductase MsrA [Clostridiaceae bacterium]
MKEIVLAGGCFWGVEEYISGIQGVYETKAGYANGTKSNPSYEEVCTGRTGHAEAVYIKYDEDILSLNMLLEKFFRIIDPVSVNRQGPDAGNQYRTGVYWMSGEDAAEITAFKEKEQEKHKEPVAVETEPLKCFYYAEEYHQKYLKKNPGGYCHIDLNI